MLSPTKFFLLFYFTAILGIFVNLGIFSMLANAFFCGFVGDGHGQQKYPN
jgi:hypothetical protein